MPKSSNEAKEIQNIIYAFQARVYPTVDQRSPLSQVLKYPPKWRIRYFAGDGETDIFANPYECYLESANYTINPSANTWHYDNRPGEIDLQLSFIETKALTAEDILKLQHTTTPVGNSDRNYADLRRGGSDVTRDAETL